jgi:sugar phosphate permease
MQAASIGSMAMAGILADVIGIRAVFLVGGAIAGLAAVIAWLLFRGADPAELGVVTPAARAATSVAVATEATIAAQSGELSATA